MVFEMLYKGKEITSYVVKKTMVLITKKSSLIQQIENFELLNINIFILLFSSDLPLLNFIDACNFFFFFLLKLQTKFLAVNFL